jgi:hypothetical protein
VLERAGTAVHAEEHVSQPLVQIIALEHVFPRCINRLLRWDGVWAIVLGVALHLLRLQPTMATATLPLISGGKLAYFSKKYEGLSFWIIHMHLWAVLA